MSDKFRDARDEEEERHYEEMEKIAKWEQEEFDREQEERMRQEEFDREREQEESLGNNASPIRKISEDDWRKDDR